MVQAKQNFIWCKILGNVVGQLEIFGPKIIDCLMSKYFFLMTTLLIINTTCIQNLKDNNKCDMMFNVALAVSKIS